MMPVSRLPLNFTFCSFEKIEMLGGIVPDIPHIDISSLVISPRWLNTGKVPPRRFSSLTRISVTRRQSILVGMVPHVTP